MKTIALREDGPFQTAAVITQAASQAPSGINIAQMRSRVRILDALEAARDNHLLLEDADYATLVEAINGMAWARADRGLLQVIDDILNPKATPASPA